MKDLNNLLQKFSHLLNKKTIAKEAVAEVVKNKTNITISPDKISLNESVLEIISSPAVSSEIMLKEKVILGELRELKGMNISRILYK